MSEGALDKQRFEAIEAYLLGTLGAEERVRFEQELMNDAELRQEVQVQRENMLAIELGGLARTLEGIRRSSDLGVGLEEQQRPARGGWRSYLKYAAVVAVLLSVAIWWIARPGLNERIYAEYHVPDPGLPVPMSISDDPVFHDAMVSFKMGEYAEAVSKWAPLLQADPTDDTLRFYTASAWLEMGDMTRAIPLFEELAKDGSSSFQRKAQWSLFLAYLRTGATEKLAAISLDADPVYGERVRAIRSELGQ